ncbi:carbohydrate ABC transporter permease [Streptosporangium canum]|uniref:carbohydrate ABC transporter permease n=1 Tax=Streptosporangium TaxID=2000 RepID=UPI0004CC98DB|nr:carbohydrate ABC transporter permease [Streptosporangium roseum]
MRAVLKYTALTLFAIPWVLVPIWLVVVNSFKPAGEAAELGLGLPRTWAIAENYGIVLDRGGYLMGLVNSLKVTVPIVVAVVFLGAAAAWAFGRSRSRWLQAAYFVMGLSILLPPSIIPTVYLLRALSLDGGSLGYVLTMTGCRLGIVIFLATGFVRAFPRDLEDAAAIDGASRPQVFVRILLPLLRPVLFVGSVILIINVWNDFFFALFLLQGSANATLPLSLFQFASGTLQSLNWNLVFAHVLLTTLPLVAVYVVAQKRVLAGLTEGALKG